MIQLKNIERYFTNGNVKNYVLRYITRRYTQG